MTTILYSELQKNPDAVLQKLTGAPGPIMVVREEGDSFVLMSVDDYRLLIKSMEIVEEKKAEEKAEETDSEKQVKRDKFKNLIPHQGIIGAPDDLVDLKVYEWTEEKNL